MEPRNLIQNGNTLKIDLDVSEIAITNKYTISRYSPEYVICGSTVFQMRLTISLFDNNAKQYKNSIFIKFAKRHLDDDLNYAIKFTSNRLEQKNKCFTNDDGDWRLVKEIEVFLRQPYTIDVTVQMDVVPNPSSFSPLYEDAELLDFELRGGDGSVHFHKAVLAASSPVLRTMLGGTWRETTEGRVDVPETSKKTLQYLKDYMYLHTLPDEDIEQLLLLALFYMMPDLEQWCVHKLIESLTPQNTCDLLKFAGKHDITRLQLAILECVDNRIVTLKEIRNHSLRDEKLTSDN